MHYHSEANLLHFNLIKLMVPTRASSNIPPLSICHYESLIKQFSGKNVILPTLSSKHVISGEISAYHKSRHIYALTLKVKVLLLVAFLTKSHRVPFLHTYFCKKISSNLKTQHRPSYPPRISCHFRMRA